MNHLRIMTILIAVSAVSSILIGTTSAHAQAKTKAHGVKAQPKSKTEARYTSRAGYSFATPAGWQFDDADISMGRVRYALVAPDTHVTASLSVSTVSDKGTTLSGLADAVRQIAKEQGDKLTMVSDKTISAGGVPAIVIETTNARPEEPDTQMTFLAVRNGVGCKIVLACKTAVAVKYAPAFNKAVSTFQWK